MSRPLRFLKLTASLLVGVLALLLAVALTVLGVDPLLTWSAPRLVGLARLELTVERIEHRLGRRLVIEGASFGVPGEVPLVRVELVDLSYRLASITSPRIEVQRALIRGPEVTVSFREDGSFLWIDRAPDARTGRRRRSEGLPFELIADFGLVVEVGELILEHGHFRLDYAFRDIDLDVRGITLQAQGVPHPTDLRAELGVEGVRFRDATIGPISLDASLVRNLVSVRSLEIELPAGRAVASGDWDVGTSEVTATASLERVVVDAIVEAFGVEDASVLPRLITGEIALAGTMPDAVRLEVDLGALWEGSGLTVEGQADGSFTDYEHLVVHAGWRGVKAHASGRLDLEADGSMLDVEARSPSLSFLDAFLDLSPLVATDLRLDARLSGDLAAPTIAGVLEIEDLAAADASLGRGRIEVGGTVMRPALEATVGTTSSVEASFDVPGQRFDLEALVEQLELGPFLHAFVAEDLGGHLGRLAIELKGDPRDLASLRGEASVTGLSLVAEGQVLEQIEPIAARFEDAGITASGALGLGSSRLGFQADMGPEVVDLDGQLDIDVELTDLAPYARRFVASLEGLSGHVALDGTVTGALGELEIDLEGEGRALAGRLRLGDREDADDGPEAAPAEADSAEAGVSLLSLSLAGPLRAMHGRAMVSGGRVAAAGHVLDDVELRASMVEGSLELEQLSLDAEGVRLEGRGSFGRDGSIDAELVSVDARLEHVPSFREAELAGTLRLELRAGGTTEDPTTEVEFEVPDLIYRGTSLGMLRLDAGLASTGAEAQLALPGGGASSFALDLEAPRAFSVDLHMHDLWLDPFFEAFAEVLPASLTGATGRLGVEGAVAGQLDDLSTVAGQLQLDTVSFSGGEFQLELREPTELVLVGGVVDFQELTFDLGDGEFVLDGRVSSAVTELEVSLDVNPAIVNGLVKQAELSEGRIRNVGGPLRLSRNAVGEFGAEGLVSVTIEALSLRAYPYAFERIDLDVHFDGDRVTVRNGGQAIRVGDGELRLDVAANLSGRNLEHAKLSFVELPYRIPGTLRVLANGNIEATGTARGLSVKGHLRIDDALYERDVEVLQGLIRPFAGKTQSLGSVHVPSPFLERTNLDLKVESGESIRIRNNVAQLVATTDLSIYGTAARPRILGQVRVVEGTVQFFDRVFDVERGNINFENPLEIDPVIQAETSTRIFRDAGNVDVTLRLEGTVSEGLELKLSSDPSYPQDDIAFLLTTGSTREEVLSGDSSDSSIRGLSLAALSLVSGSQVKERLGLEEFGLEESEGGGTRVTVGTRLSDRMRVRAVNEFGRGGAGVALAVEYELTDTVVLVAEPQSSGAFGAEIRLRFRFR